MFTVFYFIVFLATHCILFIVFLHVVVAEGEVYPAGCHGGSPGSVRQRAGGPEPWAARAALQDWCMV